MARILNLPTVALLETPSTPSSPHAIFQSPSGKRCTVTPLNFNILLLSPFDFNNEQLDFTFGYQLHH